MKVESLQLLILIRIAAPVWSSTSIWWSVGAQRFVYEL